MRLVVIDGEVDIFTYYCVMLILGHALMSPIVVDNLHTNFIWPCFFVPNMFLHEDLNSLNSFLHHWSQRISFRLMTVYEGVHVCTVIVSCINL